MKSDKNEKRLRGALTFILLMGIVSLFSDMTHEGARSILGSFLNLTGASAEAIGFVSGFGELLGYGLRIISGRLADKTKHYWTLVISGYVIQVLAIPALALVSDRGWLLACGFVIMERVGKAIKKPAKNTLVSFASSEVGQGKGFAYQEFLDQLGAFSGPVILFFISLIKGTDELISTYRLCFLFLGIPALITIGLVILARYKYPHPEMFDKEPDTKEPFVFKKSFVFYMIAISLFAFGFIDFTLITLHASEVHFFPDATLSLLYALAMGVDAFAALFFGWLFDKIGIKALILSTLICSSFSYFVFLSKSGSMIIVGIILWGIGMGAQESIMKSTVGTIMPKSMRGTGFGIFETGFGIAWFLGSWCLGALYDINISLMAIISFVVQLGAIPFYIISLRESKKENL